MPQGSIMGSLFILLYINDLKAAASYNLFYMLIIVLLVAHTDKVVVENTLSEDLQNVHRWLADNRLSLHMGKTGAILFGTTHPRTHLNTSHFKKA